MKILFRIIVYICFWYTFDQLTGNIDDEFSAEYSTFRRISFLKNWHLTG